MTGNIDCCIVFKSITTNGGLEKYVAELAALLNASIYTPEQMTGLPNPSLGEDPEVIEFGEGGWSRKILDRLPMGAIVKILEFEHFEVPSQYDLVVSVGEPVKAVIHQPHQRRIHLLNMPPRWLFDRGPGKFDDASPPKRLVKRLYQSLVRAHDLTTISRIDEFVVPSETIERRLETYYNRTSDAVIYPPVTVDRYRFESNGGYLLYLGRLSRMKRVTEIVEALSGTEYQLKVAGTGPQKEEIERLAGPNIDVLGYVSESRKEELLANCDALVFNSDHEAFGIVPIEAMASGKPVVGVNEGYTRHQISDGENGVLFSRGAESLREAIHRIYERDWDPEQIRNSIEKYNIERFRENWSDFVHSS